MSNYITTYTGVHFEILNPKDEDFHIEDIAHALSMMIRANGHYPEFYSVAQHCLACAEEAKVRSYDQRIILACLLHDASEAYLSDLTRPVKKNILIYQQIEDQLQTRIYEHFLGTPLTKPEEKLVKNVDDAELYHEFLHFMDEELMKHPPLLVRNPVYEVRDMSEVEKEYLKLYKELR